MKCRNSHSNNNNNNNNNRPLCKLRVLLSLLSGGTQFIQQNAAVFDYCSHFVLHFAECDVNFGVHKLNRDACGKVPLLSKTLNNTFIFVINIVIYIFYSMLLNEEINN